jgi:stearoyl-CoA desaturase (Delta-9 desaturase)
MKFGSTTKNISIITQFVLGMSIVGLLNPKMFTGTNFFITVLSFYVFNILGVWMTLHRYYSHRSFNFRLPIFKWIATGIAVLSGRGSPLGWVYLHRQHHSYSDTAYDPHSPQHIGLSLFGFDHFKDQETRQMKIFLVKDLMSPTQLRIHKYYALIIITFVSLGLIINPELFYFIWVLPAFLVQISQSLFNYYGHTSGNRNFETKDNSRNNMWFFPLILGECWHNNHHYNARKTTTRYKWWEIDPVNWIIHLIGVNTVK